MKKLPAQAHPDHLKKQAKELLRLYRAGDVTAIEASDIVHIAEALNFVVVDDHGQVVQSMMRSKERCLPIRAFITLAVAEDGHNAIRVPISLRCERHAARDRKSMAERAC